jgi:hypothetical protein
MDNLEIAYNQENLKDVKLPLKKRNRWHFSIIYELALQPRRKDPEALDISGEAKANHGVKPEVKTAGYPRVETKSGFLLHVDSLLSNFLGHCKKFLDAPVIRGWPLYEDAVLLELVGDN